MPRPATYRAAGEGDTLRLGPGEYLTDKATSEDTGGGYTLFEVASAEGSGVPLHEHDWAEAFYVLEGEYEIRWVDDEDREQSITATPGAFVHVPGNRLHAYRPLGPGFSKMLSINEPVGLEPIARKAGLPCAGPGAPVERDPLPQEEFSAIFAAGGIRVDQARLAAGNGVGAWKRDGAGDPA
jgi:quercetin dioxygenase-like cupin family protein